MSFGLRKLEPHEMGTGGVVRTLIRLAVPSVLAGILATAYELVDGLFISWLGKDQISGMGMGAPVLFMTYAIGAAVGLGVAALVSRLLGQNDREGARNVLNQALLISFLVGGTLSVVGPLVARPLVELLGASGDVLDYGGLYIRRAMLGAVFMHVGLAAEAGLRAQGNTMTGMRVSILGNVGNLILDGFFIFGPGNPAVNAPQVWGLKHVADFFTNHGLDLGVQGGATASVLTRLLVVALLLASLCSQRSTVRTALPWRIRPRDFWRTAGRIYRFGMPVTVSIMGMAFSAAIINIILTRHTQTAVGVLAIARRLEMLAFVPIFSMHGAVVPMVGYNLGANLLGRCRRVIVSACLIAGVLMGAFGLLLLVFPRSVLSLFTQNEEMLTMGVSYLRINTWCYFFVGCDIMLSAGFQGLGRPGLSMLVQLLRAVIVKIPVAWLLSLFLGVTGVWISSPVSTIACFVTGTIIMIVLLRRLRTQMPADPPPFT